jgi:Na+/glutamate symporter
MLDKFLLASIVALGLATLVMILAVIGGGRISNWRENQRGQDQSNSPVLIAPRLAPSSSKAPTQKQGNAKDDPGYSSQKIPHRATRVATGQRLGHLIDRRAQGTPSKK